MVKPLVTEPRCMARQEGAHEVEAGSESTAPRVRLLQEVRECVASPAMRHVLLAASLLSISNRMLWVGIPINANNFSSTQPQQYMVLVGVADGVSVLLSLALTEAVPRRLLVALGQTVIATLFLLNIFVPSDMEWARWVLVMTAFCLVALVYELTLVYFVELVPTIVRARAITIIELVGCLGEVCVPFITDILGPRLWWSVDASFAIIALAGILAAHILPETRNLPLPDTIKDVENRQRRSRTTSIPNQISETAPSTTYQSTGSTHG